MKITLELVRDKWGACPEYTADRLAALYPVPRNAAEVLTLTDGPWAEVPAADRLCTVLRKGVLSNRVLRLSACDCAERALNRERDAGREPHPYYWNAVAVAKQFALGNATAQEMRDAAYDAATANAAFAANAAAAHAPHAAATTHADAAFSAFSAFSDDADADYPDYASERRTQVDRLLTIIAENS